MKIRSTFKPNLSRIDLFCYAHLVQVIGKLFKIGVKVKKKLEHDL